MKDFPTHLAIEITNGCNFRCGMCISRNIKDTEFMDENLFYNLVDQCAAMNINRQIGINPNYQGEATTNPKFLEYCKYLNDKKICFGFTTNGQLLDKEKSDFLVSLNWFNSLVFSVDASDKDLFEKIRYGGSYDIVMSNIEYFLSKVGRKNISVAVNKVNIAGINDGQEHIDFVKKWMALGVKINTSNLCINNVPVSFNFEPKERIPCSLRGMIILVNGDAIPCCGDYKYEMVMGNVKKNSIDEIWNSEEYTYFREIQNQGRWGELPKRCMTCATWKAQDKQRLEVCLYENVYEQKGSFFSTIIKRQ